jgi:hypothetical protein
MVVLQCLLNQDSLFLSSLLVSVLLLLLSSALSLLLSVLSLLLSALFWCQCYITYVFITDDEAQKARGLALGNPFQLGLRI